MATISISVDASIKNSFQKLCSKHNTDMTKAFNVFIETCLLNQINPSEIDIYFNRNVSSFITKYHNHMISFLRSFEDGLINKLELYQSMNVRLFEEGKNISEAMNAKNDIEKTVIDEVLFNTQTIIHAENPLMGKEVFDKNQRAILKKEAEVLAKKKEK